ncbi:MAG TPA: insulinase family protein [Verrucomicrobiae bacterium]|nr:insulinase family protein [Verrucomicrobiae bacterium]
MRHAIAALLAAGVALAPAFGRADAVVPAPTMESSGGATIVRQSDPSAALVGVEVVIRAGLDRQTMRQNGLAALAAQAITQTPVGTPPLPLQDAIAARGGSVHFTVDPSCVRFYVEALASDAPDVVALFKTALASPDFSPPTVRDARASLGRQIAENQQVALRVGLDMLSRASSTEANAGLPALGTTASLAQFVPADVAAFYHSFYRSGGMVVSAVGKLDALPADALSTLVAAIPAGTTLPVTVHVAALHGTSRELVTHRDVPSPWLIAQYPAPGIDSKDFGAMLVLTAFVQRTLADIVELPGVVSPTFASRSVGAVYSYDRSPARLVMYVNGGIGNPNRSFATALSIVNVLAATRLEGSIDEFKAVAAGDFATGATNLESRAWLAAVFAQGDASPDFLDRSLRAIAATTPEDVMRVAHAYMGSPTIALVLPRQGSLSN